MTGISVPRVAAAAATLGCIAQRLRRTRDSSLRLHLISRYSCIVQQAVADLQKGIQNGEPVDSEVACPWSMVKMSSSLSYRSSISAPSCPPPAEGVNE